MIIFRFNDAFEIKNRRFLFFLKFVIVNLIIFFLFKWFFVVRILKTIFAIIDIEILILIRLTLLILISRSKLISKLIIVNRCRLIIILRLIWSINILILIQWIVFSIRRIVRVFLIDQWLIFDWIIDDLFLINKLL